jgi:PleD family two-component response regulator
MQTPVAFNGFGESSTTAWTSTPSQTVAVVDASSKVLASLEAGLDHYQNVLLLDSRAHAFLDIKRLRPSVIVVCIGMDDPRAGELLTMLTLDEETHEIPLVSLVTEERPVDSEEASGSPSGMWLN